MINFTNYAINRIKQLPLTHKEKHIVHMLICGCTDKYIAYLLDNSLKTIKHHISSIYRNLNIHSSKELIQLLFPIELDIDWIEVYGKPGNSNHDVKT